MLNPHYYSYINLYTDVLDKVYISTVLNKPEMDEKILYKWLKSKLYFIQVQCVKGLQGFLYDKDY